MIRHVVAAAQAAPSLDRVIVATDDARIAAAVRAFGGEVAMTRADHPTGTDRIAEVVESLPEAAIVVNIQGDEPELSPASIDRVVGVLGADQAAPMATLATPIRDRSAWLDPSCVKVVAARGRALYFSRASIPHHRDAEPDFAAEPPPALLHLGIYAYRREFLLGYADLPPSRLEQVEKLEQLRVLEAGLPIALGIVAERSVGIDTPADYDRFVARWFAAHPGGPEASPT